MGTDPGTIRGLIQAAAALAPDAPALLAPGREALTFSRLLELVDRTQAALSDRGVARGDRVAVVLPNGPEMAVAFLAVASAAACAPLNPAYREAEFDLYLSDLKPRALITAEGAAPAAVAAARARGIDVVYLRPLESEPAGTYLIEDSGSASAAAPPAPAEAADVALVLHTSGTTSRPKQVPLTNANLLDSARSIRRALELTAADRCLNVMPLFHIHGLAAALLAPLGAGASVVCTPGFLAPRFLDWLAEFEPTYYTAVPTMHQAILARAGGAPRASSLRFIRSCSAALPPRVMSALESVFGVPVIEAYGMTEAAHQVASNPLPPEAHKPGSVGCAAGPDIAVMDDAGALMGPRQTGEVVIRGSNVMSGYVENADANRSAFHGGWFRTGDQGWIDEDGYLFLTGRTKEMINRGGEKISPREIDEALLEHPAVAQALAFAIPDERLGEDVAAAVVVREDESVTESDLQEFAAGRLAEFKVPRRIVIVDEIPKGPTGKPQRIGLAARLRLDAPAPCPSGARDRALTPAESRLEAIWREVLGGDSLGPEDDFFDRGGDSILGAQLIVRVRDAFGVELPMFRLFGSPRLADLARWIESAPGAAPESTAPLEAAPRGSPPRASFAQERMWLLTRFEEAGPAYTSPMGVRMRGNLDAGALRSAIQSVMDRHEALRTTFPCPEGVPVQAVADRALLDLPVTDLTGLPGEERESRLRQAAVDAAFRLFDLSVDLPIRARLLRMTAQEHVLLVTVHHIAFDGWSKSILFRELSAFYRAALSGARANLPDLPIQYADYAVWQRRFLSGDAGARLETYWRKRLKAMPPVLDLPSDRPRPPRQTFRGAVERLALSSRLAGDLQRLSRAESATLFMTLLAGFQVLLHRYSRQSDICVGVPVAGRARRETEELIGLFVNVLAMRTGLPDEITFREALARVRETALGAYDHQDMPLERLVEIAQPERNLSYTPLFQAMFQLRNFPEISYDLDGLACEGINLDVGTSQFDLYLELKETAGGLDAALTYNSDQFDRPSARRILGHYQTLLEAAAADPETPIGHLPLLTEEERRQALVEWNRTEREYTPVSALKLFEEQAARAPTATAALFGSHTWSYRELDRRACGVAKRLGEIGVGPGARVAVCVDRSLDMLAALYGVWKAGAAWVPLDPTHPRERLAFIAEDAAPAAVITERQFEEIWEQFPAPLLDLGAVAPCDGGEFPGAGPDDVAYMLYTSGSTGRPKGVQILHGGLANSLLYLRDEMSVTPRDVVIAHTTLAFDLSVVELALAPISGACVAVVDSKTSRDGGLLARAIGDSGATIVQGTPATFRMLLGSGWEFGRDLRIFTGGETLMPDLAERLLSAGAVWNFYGPTECTIYCTGRRVLEAAGASAIGAPIANTRAYVVDDNEELAPTGAPGELWIGGIGVASGYWNRDELTAERFVPNRFGDDPAARLYRTGDLVRRLPDGNIDFLGRIDQQIKLRGHRIELGEIESVLREHSAVLDAAAKVVDAPDGDRTLAAWFTLHPEAASVESELRELLKSRLPSYMQPAFLIRLDTLPRTPTGKTDRNALLVPDSLPAVDGGGRRAPCAAREILLAEIWEDVLGRRPIGLDEDFFELGGHSLLGARLLTRVEKAFGVKLPLESVFLAPTIARMLNLVNRQSSGDPSMRVIALRMGTRRVPLVFSAIQVLFRPLSLRLPAEQSIYGLAYHDMSGLPVPWSLQQIAAQQVEMLLRFTGDGPVALAGWCAEGVLAFEMAQQIRARGIEVPLLVLFDSFAAAPPDSGWLTFRRTHYHLRAASRMPAADVLAYLGERMQTLANRIRRKAWRAGRRLGLLTHRQIANALRDPARALALAAGEYSPQPYSGAVLLFRPQRRAPGSDSAPGWRDLAPRLSVVDVPGTHVEMFREPNVTEMAEALNAALSEVEQNAGRPTGSVPSNPDAPAEPPEIQMSKV